MRALLTRKRALIAGSKATAFLMATVVPVVANAQQSALTKPPLVFDRVNVVDVENGELVMDQRVIIIGNRIVAVGSAQAIQMPKEARIVDAQGKYLIPGLWDMHTHFATDPDASYKLLIANGITGIRSAGGWGSGPRWVQEILNGSRVGPPRQLFSPGPNFGGKRPSDVDVDLWYKRIIRRKKTANFIKTRPFSFDLGVALRRADVPFGGHVMAGISAVEASDSGMTIIDHMTSSGGLDSLCLSPQPSVEQCQPVAERFQQNGTWWAPTIILGLLVRQMHPDQHHLIRQGAVRVSDRLTELGEKFWSGSLPTDNWLHGTVNSDAQDSLRLLSIVQRVGLPIVAATDGGRSRLAIRPPGFSLHAELAIYVTEGLTPLEALRAATLNPAQLLQRIDLLGGTRLLGTVAPGKLADLVLLDANPLADITNTTTIRAVVANGQYFDRVALDRFLVEVQSKARDRTWWRP